MKKIRFDNYNEGLLKFGNYVEKEMNDSLIKEFIEKGKLFFSYSKIREEDKMQFDNDIKATLKIKTRYNPIINSNNIVVIDNKIFSIKFIDKNKKNLFLYLDNYVDELDRVIDIYEVKSISALEDSELILYRRVFANITNINSVTNAEKESANAIRSKKKLKFKIKFDDKLVNKNSTTAFKINFENNFYDIKQIIDVNELHKILEVEGECE